jgi:transcription initiation factor TFIIH subunit 1
VRLKIGLENDNNGHNFTFTSPPPVALTEREMFKAQLSTIISNNRAAREAGVPPSPQKSTNVLAASPSPNGAANRPPASMPSRPSTSRDESVSSTGGTPVNDPIHDFRIRKKVLVKTPELAALHRELVMSGQITETEFWEGREVRSTHLRPRRSMSDVMSLSSISCSRRTLSTLRRRADQVSWLTQDRRPWKVARSKLLLRHN